MNVLEALKDFIHSTLKTKENIQYLYRKTIRQVMT
jgi:hypothetical protein